MDDRLMRWMKQVHDTQVEEIDCSDCLDQISRYVDLELASGAAARSLPLVSQHLAQCAVCREEYRLLLDLARLEAGDQLPTQEELIDKLKRAR